MGFTPAEAIVMLTRDGAEVARINTGMVASGKSADFIVLDANPLENIANTPLATGSGGDDFRRAWGERLLPALSDFKPDFVVISAGFDAHRADHGERPRREDLSRRSASDGRQRGRDRRCGGHVLGRPVDGRLRPIRQEHRADARRERPVQDPSLAHPPWSPYRLSPYLRSP